MQKPEKMTMNMKVTPSQKHHFFVNEGLREVWDLVWVVSAYAYGKIPRRIREMESAFSEERVGVR